MSNWHSMEIDQVLKELNTNLDQGLSVKEAQRRLDIYGYNELKRKQQPISSSPRRLKNILVIILFITVVLSVLVPALFSI
jgi:Ca2+-transporting ATPase